MKGTGVIGGMAYAPLLVIREEEPHVIRCEAADAASETARFDRAVQESSNQIQSLIDLAEMKGSKESAEIFDYQLLLLDDGDFAGEIRKMISEQSINADYALETVGESIKTQLMLLDNDYLRGRTADVADLVKRVHCALCGTKPFDPALIASPCIVAARDLSPSQTAGFNPSFVKGIVTEEGSSGSHSVIIARSLGIPCVIGVAGLMAQAGVGIPAILNADTGDVILSPSEIHAGLYKIYEKNKSEEHNMLSEYVNRRATTKDGHTIGVYANISSAGEADLAMLNGCDGVGLFRTEFLYMDGCMAPSYGEQLKAYSGIAKKLAGKPLVIRTLDAGGDKHIPYLGIGKESNPFLGFRAIRYCLSDAALFKTQLSAIIEASAEHPGMELMLPMIATLSELRQAKELIEDVKRDFFKLKGGKPPQIKVGMMVETPAAAIEAERFAKEADFFSIGTNDLTQYLFAADRGNEKVAYLNSCFHPALLRLVKHICGCGRKQGIAVDICGHAGEVPLLVPLFVAMGIDNLSVSIPSILRIRKIVCSLDRAELFPVLEEALSLDEASDVERLLKSKFSEIVQ